jgi:hypothetical protein
MLDNKCNFCGCLLDDGYCQRHTCPNYRSNKKIYKNLDHHQDKYLIMIANHLNISIDKDDNSDQVYRKIIKFLSYRRLKKFIYD